MRAFGVVILSLLFVPSVDAQKTEVVFDVVFKEKSIGKIKAIEIKGEQEVIRDIQSTSDASILAFSVHVETDMKIVMNSEVLKQGTAFRHANRGPDGVHAHTTRIAQKEYEIERNGEKAKFRHEQEITFCVADLYFKEPIGRQHIFSNMFTEMIPVQNLGKGRYKVTTPDKKSSIYRYQGGNLISVEMDTPIGTVISKRK